MKTSLIVSTYNKKEVLEIVLESCFDQTCLPGEILVADDGSREDTARLIRDLEKRSPVPLLHVWQPDEGYRLAASLNNAIATSSGEYLIFLDGDCFVDRHFVEDHLSYAEPGRYVAGSRVNIGKKRQEYILRTGDRRISFFSPGIRKRAHAIRSKTLAACRRHGGMAGANFSLRRSDIERVNGFNERFDGRGGCDADLARRLNGAGFVLKKMVHLGIAYHFSHSLPNRLHADDCVPEIWDSTPEEEQVRCRLGLDRALKEGSKIL